MRKAKWVACIAALAMVPLAAVAACSGSDDTNGGGAATGTGGMGGSSTGTGSDGGNLFPDGGDAGCVEGEPCGDGGVCTGGGVCCAAELACGEHCCADDQICSFQQCVTPGAECVDATECEADEYCEYSLGEPASTGSGGGCVGGVIPATGKCLPRPPECTQGQDPGDPPTCLQSCEYVPTPGQFSPVEKYSWGDPANTTHNVMMAPIVIQLDDDNCDGKVDERDIPEIVFFTFNGSDYNNGGGNSATLRAISVVGGQVVEKWSTATAYDHPGRSIAAGDIDGTPGNEIVVCTTTADNGVRAYRADGTVLWTSQPIGGSCFMPSIADIDQDGVREVIVRTAILNGQTGAVERSYSPANSANVVVSDVDTDGVLDVVASGKAYRADGSLIVDSGIVGSHPAVGDLDNDGIPEIVSVHHGSHSMSVWHVDSGEASGYRIIRQGVDINGTIDPNPCCAINPASSGCTHGGGPPTIADFDGDGYPDIGLAGGIGYVVFSGYQVMNPTASDTDTILWIRQTQDCSSAQTGSSVFDFDGDGKAEVVYADEVTFHIYEGTAPGTPLFETCNTTGTLFEYPLVADVDNDGHADIVIASNSYSGLNCAGQKTSGIRIWGDNEGKWVRTRRIWNQHPYHVTNVQEDGTVPIIEPANYLDPSLNNFRQNVQPEGEFSAPDLVVDIWPKCIGDYGLYARVRNIGEASVGPGVVVGFYDGDPAAGGTRLGEQSTTQTLYSLGSEDLLLSLASQPDGPVYAVVDDDSSSHPWHECRTDNNVSDAADPACGTVN